MSKIIAKRTARLLLGWASALTVATTALMGAMNMAHAAQDPEVTTGGDSMTSRSLVLPLGKAAIVELPRSASDVLVSDPAVVETVIRTPRRVYVMGRTAGQANAFFFDAQDEQILNLEIRVEQDADVIEDLIAKLLPSSRVTVETLGENIVLHGSADTPADAQRAVEIASRFTSGSADGETVMNMISVREPGQVMLKVRIVEMQRSLTRQLGVDLDGIARIKDTDIGFAVQTAGPAGNGLSTDVGTPGFGKITDLNYAFDAFERNGLIKTLAEPSLIAMSGEEAEFLAGGRILFPVASQDGVITVSEETFGVELRFQPVVRSKGSISLDIETSVSEVNYALGATIGGGMIEDPVTGEFVRAATTQIPGFNTREAKTTIELSSGSSFAIAGLLQENIQETIDGVPALKEAPVLGQLFRSQEFVNNETELVIIATPYLVEPTTLAQLTDPADGFAPPAALEQVLLGRLESVFGVRSRGVDEAGLQGPLGFILD
ncbi:type II and III secretion system protein family protein [Parvularcula dongshanensis]|uniref:Pilus assembly protein CpaC n=1 Tax=Parvularcula dongshanensis TaxID=1173995 RepID=A0A840HZ78_9PROT|nr:type II and III secretion system protein family protein [Parvularcula dongshanensis]MBB4657737.1 pilus assembly protein CpaC [Parvularcula dongshanensis]